MTDESEVNDYIQASNDSGKVALIIDVELEGTATERQLEEFRQEYHRHAWPNIGSAMFARFPKKIEATFTLATECTGEDRAALEVWLRAQPLVRRLRYWEPKY